MRCREAGSGERCFSSFMTFAALSTIIAVFQNIISFAQDLWGWDLKKAIAFNAVIITVLSLPCALGFNVLSFLQPLGAGTTIQDLEDFIVSNNILPLGSLVYLLFCVTRYGMGMEQLPCGSQCGKRNQISGVGKKVCDLYSSADRTVSADSGICG